MVGSRKVLSAGHGAWQQPARAPGTGEECGQPELLWSGEQTGQKDSALVPMTSSTVDPSNPIRFRTVQRIALYGWIFSFE